MSRFAPEIAVETARLQLPDGRLVERVVEIRRHPLTGESGRVLAAPFRALRVPDLRADYAGTREGCPFCPGAEERTPAFAPSEFDFPRLASGRARVFPNLFAYAGVTALTVLTPEHFVPLPELGESALADGFRAARSFFHACRDARPDLPYRLLHWNFMPPAGSTMIHPHQQLMATGTAPNRLRRLEAGARRLAAAAGGDAWAGLLAFEEGAGERWVGRTGPWGWLCDPVPLGRYFELVALHASKSELCDLTDADYLPLARGLLQAFGYLASQGFWSFNLALLGMPDGAGHFRAQARLVPRTFFPPVGCADIHFDVVQQEPIALRRPEDAAAELRAYFG